MLLPQLCKQGLHILGVPAPGLQFPVNGNDITALRCDQGALLGSQRAAAAQSLHQRGLLSGGVAKARRVQLQNAARKLCAPGGLVNREAQGRVHHIAGGIGQLLRVHPEPDRIDAGIALPQAQAAVPPLRDRVDSLHHSLFQQEHRAGFSAP